ncbi:MAG: hypothetical protein J6T10_16195 [Methanobrevibacter sp.]|nr:hypothetical protein [Methanobrevibacter sp.]
MANLLSYPSLVESPFIIVEIGGYTFGTYDNSGSRLGGKVTYPNFMSQINIVKINGQVNTYTIKMVYQITKGDDPNMLDAIFSKNKDKYGWQKIKISYGDWACPSYIYKEEEAIISKINSKIDFNSSRIEYDLSCTSTALPLTSNAFTFPAVTAKPSDLLIKLLTNKAYGLQEVFTGMTSKSKVIDSGVIVSDDKAVKIEAKDGISILSYMNYLVSCMSCITDPDDSIIKKTKYYLSLEDDILGKMGGPFFKVTKVNANDQTKVSQDSADTFTVDVGYPGNNFVLGFSINNNELWSIYYNYTKNLPQTNYVYSIDNEGNLITTYSPAISTSKDLKYTTESSKTWWTSMTEFPVTATLTIKGLMRPSILMSKVRINSYFYGNKHISSGLYIITRQEDSVSSSGYRTTLTLTRIGADVI